MSTPSALPLSPDVISMYQSLIIKDRKKVKEAYINITGNESKSFHNLMAKPDKFQPSLEERDLITREVMLRYYAATQEGYLEAQIQAELNPEEAAASTDNSLFKNWKSGRLGKTKNAVL